MENIIHIADIIAIPVFLLLVIYFFKKKNKTTLEYVLLIFVSLGFVIDVMFTIYFLFFKKSLCYLEKK
jgi:lipoprotein signal peptidase